jgi:hypothetical protein
VELIVHFKTPESKGLPYLFNNTHICNNPARTIHAVFRYRHRQLRSGLARQRAYLACSSGTTSTTSNRELYLRMSFRNATCPCPMRSIMALSCCTSTWRSRLV